MVIWTIVLHSFFISTFLYANGQGAKLLKMDVHQHYDQEELQEKAVEHWPLLTAILGLLCLLNFMMWMLCKSPGYTTKASLESSDNIINTIVREMDSKEKKELTQLDEFCLSCLTVKFVHLDHCDRCGRCVKHFNLHSK